MAHRLKQQKNGNITIHSPHEPTSINWHLVESTGSRVILERNHETRTYMVREALSPTEVRATLEDTHNGQD